MKKFALIGAIACALCLCFALVGCGGGGGADEGEGKYIGMWELDSMSDPSLGEVDGATLGALGLEITLDVQAGGSATLNMMGEELNLKWEATSDGLELSGDGGSPLTAKYDGGKLILDENGTKMVLKKQ